MITLYMWGTPNGRKASIMLEEVGLPYVVKAVNIMKGEQFAPEFLAISPNNKIPAVVDHDADGGPLAIFESGAILVYIAEKTGKLLAKSGAPRFKALEWMNWQIGGLGPMLGQLGHFAVFAKETIPYAITRYTEEATRLLTVLEKRLAEAPYLAGDEYSIADIATYGWALATTTMLKPALGDVIAKNSHTLAWLKKVGDRPAVMRGMALPKAE